MDSEAFSYSSDVPVLVDFILLQRFILRRFGEGDVVTDREGVWQDKGLPPHETVAASPVLYLEYLEC